MIELIHEHVTIDFAATWSARISDINHIFRNTADARLQSISSVIERSQTAWDKALSKLLTALEKAEG